jgi:hypothetical protein
MHRIVPWLSNTIARASLENERVANEAIPTG